MVTTGIDIGYSNLKVVIGDFSTGPRVMIRPGGACPLENVTQNCNVNPGINRLERALREQRNRTQLGGHQIDIRPAIGDAAAGAAEQAMKLLWIPT